MDKPAVQQYRYRYALRLHNGEISYQESVQSDPFRHPVGMCIDLKNISPAPQILCTQTAADVRKAYIEIVEAKSTHAASSTPLEKSNSIQVPIMTPLVMSNVDCKLGNLAPISITPEKCNAIGGTPL